MNGRMEHKVRWLAVLLFALAMTTVGCGADGGSGSGSSWSSQISTTSDSSGGSGGQAYVPGGLADAGGGGDTTGGSDSAGSTDTAAGDAGSSADDAGAADAGDDTSEEDAGPTVEKEVVPANPFVLTKADPFSTFAADVDTASYDNFLQYIGMGLLPPSTSVRLEEFVNAFDYKDSRPAPGSAHPFAVHVEAARSPFSPKTRLVRIGIAGKDFADLEKKAVNLVFLVDVSGSMSASNKLPAARELIKAAIDVLAPTDTIAIVKYASGVSVTLAPTKAAEKAKIVAAANALKSGGSTNGAGGIQLAYQQAEAAKIEGINHVVLCTDGDFNIGVSSTTALVKLIEEKRKLGITLTALGFGGPGYNDAMMEAVSNAGDGIYASIANAEAAVAYAKDGLLASIVHIAKDVKLQVEWNPMVVHAWRLLGYENRALTDIEFLQDEVDAGEIGAGHKVTALYEIVLEPDALPQPDGAPQVIGTGKLADASGAEIKPEIQDTEVVRAKVRYKLPGAQPSDPSLQVHAALDATAVADDQLIDLAKASPSLRWAVGIAAMAERLKGSPFRSKADESVAIALLGGATEGIAKRTTALEAMKTASTLLK